MNNKRYVGRRISRFESYGQTRPIDGIALVVDGDNEYRAGDQSGYVLEVTCPYGSQAMADQLLADFRGKSYDGYRAENAVIDPAAELGDGVTVNGIYVPLASRRVVFGSGRMAEISAPGESDLDHEYGSGDPGMRQIERKLAATRSYIEKTSEEIRLGIDSELDGRFSELSVTLDEIKMSLEDEIAQRYASLSVTMDEIKMSLEDDINRRYASLSVTMDGIEASLKDDVQGMETSLKLELGKITTRVSDVEGNVSSLTQTANSLQSQITSANGNISSLTQTADKINWLVKSGTSASNFTMTEQAIKMVADSIDLTGFVTVSDLSTAGKTTINGGNIRGGTLTLGGSLNGNGALKVVNTAGEEIGSWNNTGLHLYKGDIQGPSIKVGGSSNKYGVLDVIGADDVVRMRASNSSLRFYSADSAEVGSIVCDGITSTDYAHSLYVGLKDLSAYISFDDNGRTSIHGHNGIMMDDCMVQLRGGGSDSGMGWGVYLYAPMQSTSGSPTMLVEDYGGAWSNHNYKLWRGVSSSRRYKDVRRAMDAADVEALYRITPVWGKYKEDYVAQTDERHGVEFPMFIAEDVEVYAPLAVDHNADGSAENWNYRVMIPYMFQMLKAQKAILDRHEQMLGK